MSVERAVHPTQAVQANMAVRVTPAMPQLQAPRCPQEAPHGDRWCGPHAELPRFSEGDVLFRRGDVLLATRALAAAG